MNEVQCACKRTSYWNSVLIFACCCGLSEKCPPLGFFVLVCFSVAVMRHCPKATWRQSWVYFLWHFQVTDSHWQRSGQELKAGAWWLELMPGPMEEWNLVARAGAEDMEEYCLLACPHGSPNLLYYITQDCLLRNGATHNGLGPLISTINEENAHRHLRRPSAEAIEVPSSRRC